jgi:osmotically-inducible protein OsmY
MADYRNRNRFSDEDWDQQRSRQDEYNQVNYGNVNYNREDDRDRDWQFESRRNRNNYGNAGNGGTYSERGYEGTREQNYNQRQDISRQEQGYGNSYRGSDYNRRNNEWREGDSTGYGNYTNREYGNRYGTSAGYGSTGEGGYIGRNYGNENYDNISGGRNRNKYGGDTSNYGNANQGGVDRDWWNKTRDEVSSWFGDDDADHRRRMDKVSGPNRGKGPKGYHRSDDRIQEDVCDRLCDNPMIDASDVEVKVQGSEVILSGTVDSREVKRCAEDLAESVSGVTNVQNQLRVSHSEGGSTNRSGNMNERR